MEKKFSAWVQDYSGSLYKRAYQKLGEKELAEDMVQETFLSAYKARANFREESSPKTWLLAILNNKIADHYRTTMRQLGKEEQQDTKEQSCPLTGPIFDKGNWTKSNGQAWQTEQEEQLFNNKEFLKVWYDCIEDLPDTWRIVIQAKYVLHKESKAICQDAGLSASNYWQMIRRAKLLLKTCLEHSWFKASSSS